jgi:hypothetical protein
VLLLPNVCDNEANDVHDLHRHDVYDNAHHCAPDTHAP